MKTDLPPAMVVVVDPDFAAYAHLNRLATAERFRLHTYRDATTAMRSNSWHNAVATLLAIDLPDASGFEMLRSLRQHRPRLPICLVGSAYRADDERQALLQQATMYACKPLNATQLMLFLRHANRSRARLATPSVRSPVETHDMATVPNHASWPLSTPRHDSNLPRGSDRAPP